MLITITFQVVIILLENETIQITHPTDSVIRLRNLDAISVFTTRVEKKLHTFEMVALKAILGVRKLDKIRYVEIPKRVG